VGYPNEAERRRLERFPDRVAVEDLRACFALSDADRVLVFDQRGPENRLGLAVSLCALRFLGFVPDEIASIPDEALAFVAGQVDAAPHELLAYGTRAQTRSDHLQLAMTRLGWRRVDDADRARLAVWLVERAVEHDAPATLLVLVAEHLRARRLLRPPVDAPARMIATARANAHRHVEQLLGGQLATTRRGELDTLLVDADGRTSSVADLRRRDEHRRRAARHAEASASDARPVRRGANRAAAQDVARVGARRRRFACSAPAMSSDCGSSRATRSGPGACTDPSGAATPTRRVPDARRTLARRSPRARRDVRPHAGPRRTAGSARGRPAARTQGPSGRSRRGRRRPARGDRLELSPPEALDESAAAVRLRAELDRLTPRIDIPDLLARSSSGPGSPASSHTPPARPRGSPICNSTYTPRSWRAA
jgi:Domain of unknown function (DUF4158)